MEMVLLLAGSVRLNVRLDAEFNLGVLIIVQVRDVEAEVRIVRYWEVYWRGFGMPTQGVSHMASNHL